MIQVRNDITLLREENIDLPEAVFAKLMKDNYHFNIVVIYNKPRANKIEFVNSLDSFLENISSESIPTVICGDFNIDILKPNLLTKSYRNVVQSNGFELYESAPTRVTNNSATCIDHFIYNNINEVTVDVLEHQSFSDHHPVRMNWNAQSQKINQRFPFRDTSFLKNKEKLHMFKTELMISLTNLEGQISDEDDVNSAFGLFDNTFRQVLNKFAPLKFHSDKNANKCPKWFNNSLKNLRTRRNKAHSKWKKEPKNKILLEKFQKIINRL